MSGDLIAAAGSRGIDPEALTDERAIAIELLERLGVDTRRPWSPLVGKFEPIHAAPVEDLVRRAIFVDLHTFRPREVES